MSTEVRLQLHDTQTIDSDYVNVGFTQRDSRSGKRRSYSGDLTFRTEMAPSQLRIVSVATLLERYLARSDCLGLYSMLFVGSWFLLYVGMGVIFETVEVLNLPCSFLSLESNLPTHGVPPLPADYCQS